MTIRFFILQTHYRSTLDFSNEALQAAEKGLKRLWEGYEVLKQLKPDASKPVDEETEKQLLLLAKDFESFINDDLNTAKVLANMFTIISLINSFRSGALEKFSLTEDVLIFLQQQFKVYLEDIFGLTSENSKDNSKLDGVLQLIIDIRKEARLKKDFSTSDKIRNTLTEIGIALKDEKDGTVSWTIS
jgi:cysteinyl-tRNA synthetase